jgi:hypothetical protein
MPNTNDPQTLWIWVQNQIPGGVVGALILLIVGWVIARVLQAVVTGALRRTGLDRRLASAISNDPGATTAPGDTAQVIGRIVFWLVLRTGIFAITVSGDTESGWADDRGQTIAVGRLP